MKIIVSGGGTGGHIYPAIAIADKIKRKLPESEILFIGTKKGMESRLVPESGYEIRYIDSKGLDRKNLLNNFNTFVDFIKGYCQAKRIFKDFKPDLVVGTGGYVSFPVLLAAEKNSIKTYIHEQNAFPGLANRILGKKAKKIFISFLESRKHFKTGGEIVLTGNPIRKEFIVSSVIDYRSKLKIDPGEFLILSFGGSRGAARINDAVIELSNAISNVPDIRLIHVTGSLYYESFCKKLKEKDAYKSSAINVLPYTNKMHELMLASDLVICRSGAITVAELAACGKPAILIPSPNVTANHQFYNAKALADKGAAVLIEEKDLHDEKLSSIVMRLVNNKNLLNQMSSKSKDLGRTDGADAIFAGLDIQ